MIYDKLDGNTRIRISEKLRKILNREPSENEIINGQTDSNLMQMINGDEVEKINKRGIAEKPI